MHAMKIMRERLRRCAIARSRFKPMPPECAIDRFGAQWQLRGSDFE